jgi:uncharacterized protein YcbX
MHISGLFIYPVKSLRGLAVQAAQVDELGFAGDRRFLVIDEHDRFLTQRQLPRMALVSTALANGMLTLFAETAGRITVPTAPDPSAPLRTVAVWSSAGLQAEDCGPAAAEWLSDFLKLKCRLVRIGEKFRRPVLKDAAQLGDILSFADGAPVLVTSEASLANLNDRILKNIGEPVPMDRFRPNLVLSGCEAFAEDEWSSFRAGAVVFRQAGKSARCVVTTTDQLTGTRGKEPLRTLARFRRDPEEPSLVYFGANYINESKRGTVTVGAKVEFADGGSVS